MLDVVCNQGPRDRRFVEEHSQVSIAAVTRGSFQYRTRAGAAMLVPGSLLLGNAGACFECGHEHALGDRCLAFHFSPDMFEDIAAGVPGVRRTTFARADLPPANELVGLLAAAEAARDVGDTGLLEEIAVRLAGAALLLTAAQSPTVRRPTARDERRITTAVRRIEAQAGQALALSELARSAAMSRYHFLRTFWQVTGMTPYQYLLRTRLHRAALRLRTSADPVSAIALEAGFNDIATFNRRFHRLIGRTPSAFRAWSASESAIAKPAYYRNLGGDSV
ncbi:MAG TPA: AraC family transcriptional regulator [Steroidobacteraceae bacterium]|nr:AraC family transcriptional regulator [Steroidobacteraceae bacterium]